MAEVDEIEMFLLTRGARGGGGRLELELWGASARGPVRIRIPEHEDVMFVARATETRSGRRAPVELTDMRGGPVDAVYFDRRADLLDERRRLRDRGRAPLESDVRPAERYLMERFVTGACRARGRIVQRRGHLELVAPAIAPSDHRPALDVLALDIETDGFDGPVLSIAVAAEGLERVLVRGDGPAPEGVSRHPDERALIDAFATLVRERDPDVLTGWNVIEFDLAVLQRRREALGGSLRLGRTEERAVVLPPRNPGQPHVARVPGRVVVDGIAALRTATHSFDSWALEDVARRLLSRGKAIAASALDGEARVAEIRRMFQQDVAALAAYNLEDCRLVLDILAATDLVGFLVERQRLTGLPLDRQGGSVQAFDHLYLPRLHRHGHVAPDVGAGADGERSPGGYVMESEPGLHDHVLVLDFKSLYPSLIRTFRIDPMGLAFPGDDPIEGFDGATFARDRHVLPGLIEELWAARDAAKAAGDAALSRAIKILMNSFYGVLGTPGCRFFDPRLASSITRRGHEVLTRSRDRIVAGGHRVIYGDTDSLFVRLGGTRTHDECMAVGRAIVDELNRWWRETVAREHRVDSALEIELETHFEKLFMPTMRGSDIGTKKRYAGLRRRDDGTSAIVFKGLEAVRSDWTPLARGFQRELYRRVFLGEPFEAWVRRVSDDLFAGALDDQLVYRKRLRRGLDEYERNVPPHVQAARKLARPGRTVEYLMTTQGPEPVSLRRAPIDYDHYLERQLAPAADGLLRFLGRDFMSLGGRQMSLF